MIYNKCLMGTLTNKLQKLKIDRQQICKSSIHGTTVASKFRYFTHGGWGSTI